MLTLTSQYAIRSLLEVARLGRGERLTAGQIASRTGIPPKYLSMILRRLAGAGLLESQRGSHGGYRLGADADTISLLASIRLFEPRLKKPRLCPFGDHRCGEGRQCRIHAEYEAVRNHEYTFLATRTLADVIGEPEC